MIIHMIDHIDIVKEVTDQMKRGAFLTVKADGAVNTMTIGWGQIGLMWGRPVFVVPVRLSRHTCGMLEKSDDFSISVPRQSDMADELLFCGTKSGRDIDKIRALGLELEDAQVIDTPVIAHCKYHFECRILARVRLSGDDFSQDLKDGFYKNDDYHIMFYGEIVSCYLADK